MAPTSDPVTGPVGQARVAAPGHRVVVVAPATRTARAVRDVLRDWSAIGWLDPFCWLELGPDRLIVDWTADVVETGQRRRDHLQRALADVVGLTTIHIVVLTCLGEGEALRVDVDLADAVWERLQGGHAEVRRTHCIAARHGHGDWSPQVAWPGWRSLLIAPEDSWSPADVPAPMLAPPGPRRVPGTGRPPATQRRGDSAPHRCEGADERAEAEYFGHVAAGVCTIAGLWEGIQGECAPADTGVAGRPDIVLVRSFVRRLDASEVTSRLREQLLDTSRRVPPPTDGRRELKVAGNPGAAVHLAANQVCGKYAGLLGRTREELPPPRTETISALTILRHFLLFVRDALRRAPGRLWGGVRDPAAARLARRVEQVVFGGAETSYVVEVAGITSTRGRVVDLARLTRSADALAEQIAGDSTGTGYRGPRHSETGVFWKDVVRLGMSLIDGGDRVPGVDRPMEGSHVAIVDDPALIAPFPGAPFRPEPAVGAAIGAESVSVSDVLRQRQVRERLELFSQDTDQNLRAAADRSLQAMRHWQAGLGEVYICQIGERITEVVRTAIRDIHHVARLISQLAHDADTPDGQERETAERRWVRFVLAFSGVAVVALVVLGALGWVSPVIALLAAAALLGGNLIRLYQRFHRARQEEFAELHRMRQLENELPILHRNLAWAAVDLQRFLVLYQQYLAWADVLGAFVAHPHGRLGPPVDEPVRLVGPLPRAVQVGRATGDAARVLAARRALQPAVYGVGWLEALWQEAMDCALRHTADSMQVQQLAIEHLWSDPAVPEGSPLVEIATRWAAGGLESEAGEQTWQSALDRLLRPEMRGIREALLSTVVDVARGDLATRRDGTAGAGGVWTELSSDAGGVFEPSVLTPPARGQDLGMVRHGTLLSWDGRTRGGSLDRLDVLVQTSAPIESDLLCLADDAGSPRAIELPHDQIRLRDEAPTVDAGEDLMSF